MDKKDPFTHNPPFPKQFAADVLTFDRGEGVYLIDIAGNRYLDFGAGIAVNALGYGNEEIARLVYDQMKKLVHISNLFTTEPAVELAIKLTATGNFEAVHLGSSGTEANEAAIKYARLYAYRKRGPGHAKLLCFADAFHGRTLGALSVTPNAHYQEPFQPLLEGVTVLPFNDAAALERTLSAEFAGVIVEVIQGEGGLRVMTSEFARALNQSCAKHDVILIADEVQTGLGRTGYPYASGLVGLQPDIITLAKPLGGGLPLSATLIPAKVNQLIRSGEHGTTFGGGPVTTAVASRILDRVLDPAFLEGVRSKAAVLDEGLKGLATRFSFIQDLRGAGMLRGIAVDEKRAGTTAELITKAREAGLIILRSGANVLRIAPPLVIEKEEIAKGLSLIEQMFARI